MAEGVDAVAIDVGDGAIGADGEIAGHHLDADHGAGLEIGGIAHGGRDFAAAGDALAGSSPRARSWGAKVSRVARLKPPKESGVAMSDMRASPWRAGSGGRSGG
jgi:hypothetical protein